MFDVLKKLNLEEFNQEFLHHYDVLLDSGLIASTLENGYAGVEQGSNGDITWTNIPIRLTAEGHKCIEIMNNKEIWKVIKKEFKVNSVKTVIKLGADLAEDLAKKRIENILAE